MDAFAQVLGQRLFNLWKNLARIFFSGAGQRVKWGRTLVLPAVDPDSIPNTPYDPLSLPAMILKLCVCFGVWIPNQNKQVDKYQVALSFLKVPDPKLGGSRYRLSCTPS